MSKEENFLKFQHVEKVINNNTGSGAIYGLGIIGALIYYIQHADGFWAIIVGIVKAIFWPAVILYEVLRLLNL